MAELDGIAVVTGGFFGVGQVISQSYELGRHEQDKAVKLWHVLPQRDDKVWMEYT